MAAGLEEGEVCCGPTWYDQCWCCGWGWGWGCMLSSAVQCDAWHVACGSARRRQFERVRCHCWVCGRWGVAERARECLC
jgi:hypothetical protein